MPLRELLRVRDVRLRPALIAGADDAASGMLLDFHVKSISTVTTRFFKAPSASRFFRCTYRMLSASFALSAVSLKSSPSEYSN
jgi:hypothetical protein